MNVSKANVMKFTIHISTENFPADRRLYHFGSCINMKYHCSACKYCANNAWQLFVVRKNRSNNDDDDDNCKMSYELNYIFKYKHAHTYMHTRRDSTLVHAAFYDLCTVPPLHVFTKHF